MPKENLYNLVNKTTTSGDRQSKVQIGYTVDTYRGVLEALKQIEANTVREGGGSVFGDDYSGLQSLRFDNLNFSEDTNACLWKMELGLFGSLPILYKQSQRYGIVCVRGNTESQIGDSGCYDQCPFILDKNKVSVTKSNFISGAYVDVDNHLVHYMNKFFTGQKTSFKWTGEICWKLIHNKCLVAQIIPEGGGTSSEVLIVGRCTPANSSRILINPSVAVSSNLNSLGLNVNVSGQGIRESLSSEGSEKYRCPIQGKSYKINDGTISDLTYEKFNTWAERDALSAGEMDQIEIDQLESKNYHIRIYIPANKKATALKIIPDGLPETLYQTYSAARYGEGNIPAGVNADVRRMMECITQACVKFNCKLFTQNDVVDAKASSTAFGSSGGWISGKGRNTAMAGHFFIPNGWPMCKINQNYGGRSGEDQRAKGHPSQGSGDAVDWVVPDNPDRMDSALNNLDSSILSGSKDREWYQARLEKANKGCIKIYCNSKVASKFQSFFNEMWDIYKESANIYNMGRPIDQQISPGEILLRCAPCLCAINGNSGFHRSRKDKNGNWRQAGHDGGSAIDFDPSHNGTTSSKSTNCNTTEIGKGMEVAYRPMLHVLYKYDGGWGGSYKFCSGLFDAMHVQF